MGLVAGQDGAADGYELAAMRPDHPGSSAAPVALLRRRSAQASRRGVLHLQTATDGPVSPDLASWYTERGFHFYVATLAWPGRPRPAEASAAADDPADSDPAAAAAAGGDSDGPAARGATRGPVEPDAAADQRDEAGPPGAANGPAGRPDPSAVASAVTALRAAGSPGTSGSGSSPARPGRPVPRQAGPAPAGPARLAPPAAADESGAAAAADSGTGSGADGTAAQADGTADQADGSADEAGGTADQAGDSADQAVARTRAGRRGRKALKAAFAELDARCAQLRAEDGIDNVIVMAHGAGALAAALWCAAQPPDGQADALILYGPDFAGLIREELDIACPVLVIGGSGGQQRRRGPALRRRPAPATTVPLGRHVTWLHPADAEARPDAGDSGGRSRFFNEMGRWLGAYMYGQVRDQLL
ncbi:MAG TPA: hypothetical protein VGG35_11440 [Streptosporangiaceae bacterium]